MSKTITIPEEYLAYDFGFSGTDAPAVETHEIQPPPILDPEIETKIDSLHTKIDDLVNSISGGDTSSKLREDIRKLEAIIVPLLNNLLKTKDKEYIFWPNRGPIIEKQLEMVLAITRG